MRIAETRTVEEMSDPRRVAWLVHIFRHHEALEASRALSLHEQRILTRMFDSQRPFQNTVPSSQINNMELRVWGRRGLWPQTQDMLHNTPSPPIARMAVLLRVNQSRGMIL